MPPASRFPLAALALLLSPAAWAHYPHDVAYWAAISPDPGTRRIATSLERIDLDILGRSDNGLDWAARLIQADDDGLTWSGAFLSPTRLVLAAGNGGLKTSDDAGDSLAPDPYVTDSYVSRVVASPAVLDDGIGFAAGTSGLWRTADAGSTWQLARRSASHGISDVSISPEFAADHRVCGNDGGALVCSADSGLTWTRGRLPASAFRLSVGAAHRLWAVVRDDGLYESLDDGITWTLVGFQGEDVTIVTELSGGLVLLGEALSAEWRSADAGATWTNIPVDQITENQSTTGDNFFDFTEGPDGAIYLSEWNGLARSDDRGLTYQFYNTEPIQNTHSVVLTEGADHALDAWVGTYGGGPTLTDIHTFASRANRTLPRRTTRNTPTTPHWERDGTAIFDEGYTTWRTTDWGATWDDIAIDPEVDHSVSLSYDIKGVALSPEPGTDPFLLTTVGQGTMAFVVSDDLGDTWATGTQTPVCAKDAFAVALSPRWPDESRAWAACGGAIYESDDRGASWSVVGDTGASFVFRIAEETDGTVLVATSDGLWAMAGGATTQVGFDGALVVGVTASTEEGDDTVFALVPTEGWFRSDDGGASWVTLPAPTADVPRMVSMSPTYATDGSLAVAGYGGAWASIDRGESWFSIYAMEVYEGNQDSWRSTGTWTGVEVPGTSGGEVVTTEQVGATRTLDFHGIAAALEAPGDSAAGVVAVSLDGGPAEQVTMPTGTNTVWSVDGLDGGWHTLTVEAGIGTTTIDDVRITRIAELPSDTADSTAPSARCGCAGDGSSALVLLPLALLRRRRVTDRHAPSPNVTDRHHQP